MLCSDCFHYFHWDHSEPPAIKNKKSVHQKETLMCEETIYLNPFSAYKSEFKLSSLWKKLVGDFYEL